VRKLMWWLTAAMAAGLMILGPTSPAPAAESAQVFMVDNEPDLTNWHFDPAEVTVPAGATVRWVNKGKEEHTVTADDKSFDSGMKRSGTSFQRVFSKPGRYTYYCAPHPWMKGAVRVVGAAAAAERAASEAGAAPGTATSSATAPPSTTTTIPATFAPPATGRQDAGSSAPPVTATSGPPAEVAPPAETSEDEAAAVSRRGGDDSGDPLAGTLALVLVPTVAGLAVGAKLRQRSSSAEA
jgi:plastocyanin